MTFKKTLTVSIMLHICFFSSALLFSEGFMKGRGDLSAQKVLFVILSDNQDRQGDRNKMSAVPESRTVQREIKPVAIEKERVAEAEIVVTNSDEPVRETDQLEIPAEGVAVDEQDLLHEGGNMDHDVIDFAGDREIVQAVYDATVATTTAAGTGSLDGAVGAGLLPGTIELIKNAIERVKTYPAMARRRGMEGTVYVSFSINTEGRPQNIMVLKSSGFNILDRATVNFVIKAAPYPFIQSRVELPVAYRLEH